jgi:transcriptional regulator with XRE-family HTH domain
MGISLNDKLSKLSKSRQDKIDNRAQKLIQEELTLRDLRAALEKTQVELCKVLDMKQDGISRLEHRSDMLISTLTKYINAMGGTLKITAEFPDRLPVQISGIESIDNQKIN